MGLTGLALVLFVLGHMVGNLLIFAGPEAINGYAEFLHEVGHGMLIWVARAGLLLVFSIHMFLAFLIRAENKRARPVAYDSHAPQVSNWASRHMLLSGLVILVFVLYHIAHFTMGWTDLSHDWRFQLDEKRPHYVDVFSMVVFGFRDPYIAVFYLVAQLLLATHLWHGASSWFQSVGLNRRPWRSRTSYFGPLVALVVFVGNCSIPTAIQLGYGLSHLKEMDPNYKIPNTIVQHTMGNVWPTEDEDGESGKGPATSLPSPPKGEPLKAGDLKKGGPTPKLTRPILGPGQTSGKGERAPMKKEMGKEPGKKEAPLKTESKDQPKAGNP